MSEPENSWAEKFPELKMALQEKADKEKGKEKKSPPPDPAFSTGKDVWVVSNRGSNHVVALYFREPHPMAFDPRKYNILKTRMSPKEIAVAHDLRSRGGHPKQGRGMVGI